MVGVSSEIEMKYKYASLQQMTLTLLFDNTILDTTLTSSETPVQSLNSSILALVPTLPFKTFSIAINAGSVSVTNKCCFSAVSGFYFYPPQHTD